MAILVRPSLALCSIALLLAPEVAAQPSPSPRPTAPAAARAPEVVSPEVHPDGRVTFRLLAPKAAEVAVAGEWTRPEARPTRPQKLTRDAAGRLVADGRSARTQHLHLRVQRRRDDHGRSGQPDR